MFSPDKHYEIWKSIRHPFLFPCGFAGHTCVWEQFTFAQAGCSLCSKEHRCPSSECRLLQEDDGHASCQITGCVVKESQFFDEWKASDRAYIEYNSKENTKVHSEGLYPCDTWEFVNSVVKELLCSKKSILCRKQEIKKKRLMQVNMLHKQLRNVKSTVPNMLHISANIAWSTRKLRDPICLETRENDKIISTCTNAITKILLKYKSIHIKKITNNENRMREFVCSMIYLTRNGVNCKGKCILPQLHIMKYILPLESCLPTHFKVRAKSITEGENVLKIELRYLPQ